MKPKLELNCPFCSWSYRSMNKGHLYVIDASDIMIRHLRYGCPIRYLESNP